MKGANDMHEVYKGLPTMSLLPLVNTNFKIIKTIKLDIPRKGAYNKIAPAVFGEDDGEFDLLSNDILYLPAITKILLAVGKYPQLNQNQIFTIRSFEFEEDLVVIQGGILEIITIETVKGSSDG